MTLQVRWSGWSHLLLEHLRLTRRGRLPMNTTDEIKEAVRSKYDSIARGAGRGGAGCSSPEVTCVGDSYAQVRGYVAEADLGLGCGIPTEVARISEGDTVLDLGSGAGNDCFVARAAVGEAGRVIGVDMVESMVEKARANAERLGFRNVEFRLGEIEALPVESNSVDVVLSNCVLNLVPDKRRAFSETFRVLRPGGRFSISDIVAEGELPERVRRAAEAHAGCVAGTMPEGEYLDIVRGAGFEGVGVARRRGITVPEEVLLREVTGEEARAYGAGGRLVSVTVYGEKPRRAARSSEGAPANSNQNAEVGTLSKAMHKAHSFRVGVRWTGNSGEGTSAYRAYERAHEITAEGKPAIAGSSDPAFRGDAARYNPEELLVAALSACHMLSYLHLCADSGVVVTAYEDRASGTMRVTEDGGGHFAEVVLRPAVTIRKGCDPRLAQALHERAHHLCFIAGSVNFEVRNEPTVSVE